MSISYCHTLIPVPEDFKPPPIQVQDFLCAVVALGVIGGERTMVMRTPSDRQRVFKNPFTGATESRPMQDHTKLEALDSVSSAIGGRADYAIEVSGSGVPENPPLPIDFEDPYHVGIVCRFSSVLCCTSDQHDEVEGETELPSYGRPMAEPSKLGLFVNPRSGERIEVAGAGCAHFWIEFHLGKFLFPRFEENDLRLLDSRITDEAVGIFGVRFVEGCSWG